MCKLKEVKWDYSKLRARMVEMKFRLGDVAIEIGVSYTCMLNKMSSKNDFTQTEIAAICDLLEIPGSEIGTYFFTEEVAV